MDAWSRESAMKRDSSLGGVLVRVFLLYQEKKGREINEPIDKLDTDAESLG